MKRTSLVLALAILALPSSGPAQVADALLPGGGSPGPSAVVFAPGLVSGAGEEYGVAVTGDWSEIYFTRLTGERSTVMRTRRVGTGWTPAAPASFSGEYNDSHPWLADGGRSLYFVSQRPCPGARQPLNVWVVERSNGDWAAPRSLGVPVTDQTVHAPSVSLDGAIYATGLIRLRRDGGGFLPAERLDPPIVGSHPAVAPDQSFIVFSARSAEGAGGTDLYAVFRESDGSWTTPASLGPAVNTPHVESSPTLSSDGRFLFFSRQGDVWWADASVIAAARPPDPGDGQVRGPAAPVASAQLTPAAEPSELPREVTIADTKRHELASAVVDDVFKLHVSLPRGYQDMAGPLPVVYLLDAEYSFGAVAYAIRRLIKDGMIPPVILVGLAYEVPYDDYYARRERDFTPTAVYLDDFPHAGHAAAFARVLREEVIPFVERTYRVRPNDRTIMGLSFSGLFTTYLLFKEPGLFDRYIITSPSLWWDDGILFRYEAEYWAATKALPAQVYFAAGDDDGPNILHDLGRMEELLASRRYRDLDYRVVRFPDETHRTVFPLAVSHGLRFLFGSPAADSLGENGRK